MTSLDLKKAIRFYREELTENILSFWMPRCLDRENGGYVNCFTNDGSRLVSRDKYTWSQGRFLWLFSRLAASSSDAFSPEQRRIFLSYAAEGERFLLKHALIAPGDWRCVFLTDAAGTPKTLPGYEGYDLSISADCFVVMGFAAYSLAADDREAWTFARDLADSVWDRYYADRYRSLPYPVSPAYVSHARPMILTNILCELYKAAGRFEPGLLPKLKERIRRCHREVFEIFRDGEDLIHEFRHADGSAEDNLFVEHINPGHTLEDMWFQAEASDILGDDPFRDRIAPVVLRTLEAGWDGEFGGFFHFVPVDGLRTAFAPGSAAEEPQMKLMLDDWGSKLWWVHSEALYTTLLMHFRTGREEFLAWHRRIRDYVFRTFPNPDREIREWIQIRTREGRPQEKVVALPVKDPYHIARNLLLIIELLEKQRRDDK